MNIRGKTKQVCFIVLVIMYIQLYAQNHFTFTPNTGNNMTVLVRTSINPNINGESLEAGDEIGVFNRDGLCVGAITWNQQNAAITVWGDNDQTESIDGIAVNDTLHFRVWDKSQSNDMIAIVTFENETHLTYAVDRIAKLQTLTVPHTMIGPQNNIVFQKNERDGELITIFDIRGKTIINFIGIGVEAEIAERIKKNGLPHGNYLAVIKTKKAKRIKIFRVRLF